MRNFITAIAPWISSALRVVRTLVRYGNVYRLMLLLSVLAVFLGMDSGNPFRGLLLLLIGWLAACSLFMQFMRQRSGVEADARLTANRHATADDPDMASHAPVAHAAARRHGAAEDHGW